MVPADVAALGRSTRRSARQLIDMQRCEPRAASRATRGATPRCCPRTRSSRPRTGAPGTVHVDAVDAKGNMASFTPSGALDLVGRGDRAARLSALGAHDDLLPRAGASSQRGGAGQAPAHHAHALDGVPQRQALDGLRHHGRRQPGAVAAAVLPVPRGVRHVDPGGDRGAARCRPSTRPGFFAPHAGEPNRVRIEPRFGAKVLDELRRRGHDLDVAPDWTEGFVSCAAVRRGHRPHRGRLRPARLEVGMLPGHCNGLVENRDATPFRSLS